MTNADAYEVGLRLLARRELSMAQIRQRLAQRGFPPTAIDHAIARLCAERAVDDRRAAQSLARTQSVLKGRGKLRVRRQLESAGISADIARQAVEDAYESLDETALLEAALARRLGAGQGIASDAEFRRLYRYLVGQGFEPDPVTRLLVRIRARSRSSPGGRPSPDRSASPEES